MAGGQEDRREETRAEEKVNIPHTTGAAYHIDANVHHRGERRAAWCFTFLKREHVTLGQFHQTQTFQKKKPVFVLISTRLLSPSAVSHCGDLMTTRCVCFPRTAAITKRNTSWTSVPGVALVSAGH